MSGKLESTLYMLTKGREKDKHGNTCSCGFLL